MKQFLFVVVLYKAALSDTSTFRSLMEQSSMFAELGVHLLVVDNTPGEQPREIVMEGRIDYVAVGENRGLANAYQLAFLKAKAEGYRFIVLLDHDSKVGHDFFVALRNVADSRGLSNGIWCPSVVCLGTPISPWSLNAFGWPNYRPTAGSRLHGINSFSVLSVVFVDNIGGFDQFYWLDCLDFWLYEMAHRRGWAVTRLDVTLEHDLSLVSGKTSLTRMETMAFYESCFALEYGAPGRIAGTLLRLIGRGFKRQGLIGGFINYLRYLREVCEGMRAGLKRRGGAHHLSNN